MLIALSEDDATVKGIHQLKTLYPKERALRFHMIVKNFYTISHEDEKPIRRITIVGHNNLNNVIKYGGMQAAEFAQHLYQILCVNSEGNPRFLQDLKAIDLIGCAIGFVSNQQPSCFAEQVAKYLQDKGCHVPINTFTNLSLGDEALEFSLVLRISIPWLNPETTWEFVGFKSRKDIVSFMNLYEEESKELKLIDKETLELFSLIKKEQDIKTDIGILEARIQSMRKEIQDWKAITHNTLDKNNLYQELIKQKEQEVRGINSEIEIYHEAIRKLHDEQYQVSTTIEKLKEKHRTILAQQESCLIRIAQTDNPRSYFDAHPECNFMNKTPNQTKSNTVKTFRKYKKNTILPREESNDDHPLVSENLPSKRH